MDQQTGQQLLDDWAAQQSDETIMAIERGFVQPGRSFSREAVEELAFAITLFIQSSAHPPMGQNKGAADRRHCPHQG